MKRGHNVTRGLAQRLDRLDAEGLDDRLHGGSIPRTAFRVNLGSRRPFSSVRIVAIRRKALKTRFT
jgi:hypothetical protein